MKKFLLFSLLVLALAVLVSPCAHAEKYALGNGDVALKVDYFRFMDSLIEDNNAENGVYVGIEAYKQLFLRNLYLGMEVGWAGTSGSTSQTIQGPPGGPPPLVIQTDSDITYVPIELNAKYVFPINQCLTFDLGGGVSFNYFDLEFDSFAPAIPGLGISVQRDDWVFGGQFFAGLNYKYQCWFLGANVKYQITENLDLFGGDSGMSADNFRAGLQVGYMF